MRLRDLPWLGRANDFADWEREMGYQPGGENAPDDCSCATAGPAFCLAEHWGGDLR